MPKTVPPARYLAAIFAALAGLAVLVAPIESTFAQKPSTPVTVVNPEVPVTVVNPATSPALTSSVDDPGRIAYQSDVPTGSGFVLFPVVPPGHRLVIQHVSGFAIYGGAPTRVVVDLSTTPFFIHSAFFAPLLRENSFLDHPV